MKKFILIMTLVLCVMPLFANYVPLEIANYDNEGNLINYMKCKVYFKNNNHWRRTSREYNTLQYLAANEFAETYNAYLKSLDKKYDEKLDVYFYDTSNIGKKHNGIEFPAGQIYNKVDFITVSTIADNDQVPIISYLRSKGGPIPIKNLQAANIDPTGYFNQDSYNENNRISGSSHRSRGGHNNHEPKGYSSVGHSIGAGLGGAAGAVTGGTMGGMMGF